MDMFVKLALAVIIGAIISFSFLRAKWMNKKRTMILLIILSIIFFVASFCMPVFIVLGVSSIICSLIIIIAGCKDEETQVNVLMVGLFFAVITMFALFGFFYIYNPAVGTEKILTSKINLVAIEDNDMISGYCSLIDGRIDSVRIYEYYYTDSSGGERYAYIRADSISVFEEESSGGFIGTYEIRTIKKWPEIYQTIYGFPPQESSSDRPFQEIHVLRGTIKRSMNIDLSSRGAKT